MCVGIYCWPAIFRLSRSKAPTRFMTKVSTITMSNFDLHISGLIKPTTDTSTIAVSFAGLAILYYLGQKIYDVYFGPLSKFPGPPLRAWTKIPSIQNIVVCKRCLKSIESCTC